MQGTFAEQLRKANSFDAGRTPRTMREAGLSGGDIQPMHKPSWLERMIERVR